MSSEILFQRYKPYDAPSSFIVSDEDQKRYQTLDEELRDTEQFKRIVDNCGYNLEEVGYLIEQDGDKYWIRLMPNESDPGPRYYPDATLREVLKKFYRDGRDLPPTPPSRPASPIDPPVGPPTPVLQPSDPPIHSTPPPLRDDPIVIEDPFSPPPREETPDSEEDLSDSLALSDDECLYYSAITVPPLDDDEPSFSTSANGPITIAPPSARGYWQNPPPQAVRVLPPADTSRVNSWHPNGSSVVIPPPHNGVPSSAPAPLRRGAVAPLSHTNSNAQPLPPPPSFSAVTIAPLQSAVPSPTPIPPTQSNANPTPLPPTVIPSTTPPPKPAPATPIQKARDATPPPSKPRLRPFSNVFGGVSRNSFTPIPAPQSYPEMQEMLRAQQEQNAALTETNRKLAELIAILGAQHSNGASAPIDPNSIVLLKNEVEQLQSENKRLQQEIVDREQTLANANRTISDLEDHLQTTKQMQLAAEESAAGMERRFLKADKAWKDVAQQLDDATTRENEQGDQIQSLQQELKTTQTKCDRLQKLIDAHTEELRSQQATSDQLIEDLRGELQNAFSPKEILELQKEIAFERKRADSAELRIETEIVALTAKLETMQDEYTRLQEESQAAESKWHELDKLLVERNALIEELQSQQANSNLVIEDLQAQLQNAFSPDEIRELQKEIAVEKARADSAESLLKIKIQVIEQQHQTEIKTLQQQFTALQESSAEELRVRLDQELGNYQQSLQREEAKHQAEIESLTAALEELRQRPVETSPNPLDADNEQRILELLNETLEQSKKLSEAEKEINRLREDLYTSASHGKDLLAVLENTTSKLRQVEGTLAESSREHKQACLQFEHAVREAEAEISLLKTRAAHYSEALQAAFHTDLPLDDLIQEIPAFIQKEKADLERALSAERAKLAGLERDAEGWKENILLYRQAKEEEIASLEKQNVNLEAKLSSALQVQKELREANRSLSDEEIAPLYDTSRLEEQIAFLTEELTEVRANLADKEASYEEALRVQEVGNTRFSEMQEGLAGKEAKIKKLELQMTKLEKKISARQEQIDQLSGRLKVKDTELFDANEIIADLRQELNALRGELSKASARRNALLGDFSRSTHSSPDRPNSPPLDSQMLMEYLADTAPALYFQSLTNALPETVKGELGRLWNADRNLLNAADQIRLVDGNGTSLGYQGRLRQDATLTLIQEGRDPQFLQDIEEEELKRPLEQILNRIKSMSSPASAEGDLITSGRLTPRISALLQNINQSFQSDCILSHLTGPVERRDRKSLIIACHFLCNYISSGTLDELAPFAEELISLRMERPEDLEEWLASHFTKVSGHHLVQDLLFLDATYHLEGEEMRQHAQSVVLKQRMLESGLLPALRSMLN